VDRWDNAPCGFPAKQGIPLFKEPTLHIDYNQCKIVLHPYSRFSRGKTIVGSELVKFNTPSWIAELAIELFVRFPIEFLWV